MVKTQSGVTDLHLTNWEAQPLCCLQTLALWTLPERPALCKVVLQPIGAKC